ncbi:Xaa-Pro peptidase family protein [Streptomyces sp. NPDC048277]|uniref:Xaa-Pro peptidase family protein n=1 Tax=Streptomyces sp. NPDC048277 TaxID=3155027 RepID=UPI0033E59A83
MQTPRWYSERASVSKDKDVAPIEVPVMSLEERDRRWAAIREKMLLRGIDCLIVVGTDSVSSSGMANVRYLTQLGPIVGALVIFPLTGDPIVYSGAPQMHLPFGRWQQVAGRWVDDVRTGGGVGNAVDAVTRLGLAGKRLGIVGYRHLLSPLSDVSAAFMSGLSKGLPHADISDETSLIDELRMIKSEEEQAFLRRAGEIARKRVARLVETAQPGATEAEVWAAMEHEGLVNGAEPGTFNLFASGPVGNAENQVVSLLHGAIPPHTPTQRVLGEGDLIISEFHTSFGGYLAHTEFSVFIGEAPSELRDLHHTAVELARMAESVLIPDATVRSASTALHEFTESEGLDFVELGFHGHGLSSPEFPAAVFRDADQAGIGLQDMGEVRLRENMVFGQNIDIHNPAWRKDVGVMFGGTVVVKSGGAERLCDVPRDVFEVPVRH